MQLNSNNECAGKGEASEKCMSIRDPFAVELFIRQRLSWESRNAAEIKLTATMASPSRYLGAMAARKEDKAIGGQSIRYKISETTYVKSVEKEKKK